jgi:hypothetical protein
MEEAKKLRVSGRYSNMEEKEEQHLSLFLEKEVMKKLKDVIKSEEVTIKDMISFWIMKHPIFPNEIGTFFDINGDQIPPKKYSKKELQRMIMNYLSYDDDYYSIAIGLNNSNISTLIDDCFGWTEWTVDMVEELAEEACSLNLSSVNFWGELVQWDTANKLLTVKRKPS